MISRVISSAALIYGKIEREEINMDIASTVIVPDNPKEIKAAISHMLRQIDEIREQMKATDVDMARMNAQYDATRTETLALRKETEIILARLRESI